MTRLTPPPVVNPAPFSAPTAYIYLRYLNNLTRRAEHNNGTRGTPRTIIVVAPPPTNAMHAFLAVLVGILVATATGAGVAETAHQANGNGANEQLVDFSSTAIAGGGPDPVHVAAHRGAPRSRAQAKGYPRPQQIGVPQQGGKSRTSTANASKKRVPKYVRSQLRRARRTRVK